MNYSEKLKNPKWQKKRLEIMERDCFKCRVCDDDGKSLHVHHIFYDNKFKNPWDYPNDLLITLCEDCHSLEHEIDIKEVGLYLMQDLIKLSNQPITYIYDYIVAYKDVLMKFDNYTEKEAIKSYLLSLIREL